MAIMFFSILYFLFVSSFLYISARAPDLYIPRILKDLKEKTKCDTNEDEKLLFVPKILGWIERILYYLFLIIFLDQFVIFLGIWLTLKTVVIYKSWEKVNVFVDKNSKHPEYPEHIGRAKFMIFLIGNGLSIISVLLFFSVAKFIINL